MPSETVLEDISGLDQSQLEALQRFWREDLAGDRDLNATVELAVEFCHADAGAIVFHGPSAMTLETVSGMRVGRLPHVFKDGCELPGEGPVPESGLNIAGDLFFGRAYAPLLTAEGLKLGTLSVFSARRRTLSTPEREGLQTLANAVMNRLELMALARDAHAEDHAHYAESPLATERNFVSAVLDTVGALVVVTDSAGNLVRYNSICETISGYSLPEVYGRPVWETLIEPGERDTAKRFFEQMVHDKLPARYRGRWQTKSGELRTIQWDTTSLTRSDGEVHFYIATGIDITERAALDRMKDEFISTVSHELRTPLTGMRASLGLIASGALVQKPEKQAHMLAVALSNTERLVELVNDILEIERIDAGHTQLKPSRFDAARTMKRAAEMMEARAQKEKIDLRFELHAAEAWADEGRILQVVCNLLSNALKFTTTGGCVTLGARRHSGQEIRLEVRDTGRGIPPNKLESIFGRFQQVDASDSRAKGGTGLGLAICRALTERQGGRIWAESVLGCGSSFYVVLPCALPS